MWMKFRTTAAGPHFSAQPDQVVDVPERFVPGLIEGGYAYEVPAPARHRDEEEEPAEVATDEKGETATLDAPAPKVSVMEKLKSKTAK
jgi:hypothetical protein